MNQIRAKRIGLAVAIAVVLALLAMAFFRSWQDGRSAGPARITPQVMGTASTLIAVGPGGKDEAALNAALAEIRAVESAMSRHDPATPLSRFNQAPADIDVPLDEHTLTVMRFGQVLADRTGGAFDVTMLPLGRLWAQAEKRGQVPTESELADVARVVGFEKLEVGRQSARKTVAGLAISLDAIAKGYAVDRAVEAMKRAGAQAGLVEIGGDVRTFGSPADSHPTYVHVRNPFDQTILLTLAPLPGQDLAVCTSGNYHRFVTIAGRRYSHIIDPRTGQPADATPSVTVVAPDTMAADGWATALSVLSIEQGRKLIELEPGVEALWVTGTQADPQLHYSAGFERYVKK